MKYTLLNKALLFKGKKKVLVISDLHLGFEQALNDAGILVPRTQLKQVKEELDEIFKKIGGVDEVVINGDLKHEFGRASSQEWSSVLNFLDYLEGHSKKIVLIRGNHDTIMKPIAERRKLELKKLYKVEDVLFIHGDKYDSIVLDKKIKTVVMGHKHPAILIRNGARSESYKCFLIGKWKRKEIIILPSFFPLIEGTDVTIKDTMLDYPFNLTKFKAYVVADKIYDFGTVKAAGRLID